MDLPTYTNIWRIEKRLYKLYDFRLPMPLPISWIAVFCGITVPYVVVLAAIGVPFDHNLFFLYVLPPGVLTWLSTRPVLENKRLHELLGSQLRYLGEPSTYCRMVPLAEKNEIRVYAKVWHRFPALAEEPALAAASPSHQAEAAGPGRDLERRAARDLDRARRGGRGRPAPDLSLTLGGGRAAVPGLASSRAAATAPSLAAGRAGGSSPRRGLGRSPGGAPGLPPSFGPGGTPEPGYVQSYGPSGARVWPEAGAAQPSARPAAPVPIRARGGPDRAGRLPGGPDRPAPLPAGPDRTGRLPARADNGAAARPGRDTPAQRPAWYDPASRSSGAQVAIPGEVLRGPAGSSPAAASGPASASGSASAPSPAASAEPPRGPGTAAAPTDRPAAPVSGRTANQPGWAGQTGSGRGSRGADRRELGRGDQPRGRARPLPIAPPSIEVSHETLGPQGPSAVPLWGRPNRRPAPQPPAEPTLPSSATSHLPAPEPAEPATRADIPAPPDAADTGAQAEPVTRADLPAPAGLADPTSPPASAEPSDPSAPAEAVTRTDVPAPPPPAAGTEADLAEPTVTAESLAAAEDQALVAARARSEARARAEARARSEAQARAEARARAATQRPSEPQPPAPARRPNLPSIERALSGPGRIDSWQRRVRVVPGGQGPGQRDREGLDRDRAKLPLTSPHRIVVLGCTSGAGQTLTALMTGQVLAALREAPVAAIDLNPGHASLSRQSQTAPVLTIAALLAGAEPTANGRGAHPQHPHLDVIVGDADPASPVVPDERDYSRLAEQAGRRYQLTLIDPGAAEVTRILGVADQLVLVAPASADAPRSLGMTQEWLSSHGYGELSSRAVTVVNGVSKASMSDVEQAESVARGRCRAIVRIPWDGTLAAGTASVSSLRPQVRHAYTALAGVLVAGLAAAPVPRKVLQ